MNDSSCRRLGLTFLVFEDGRFNLKHDSKNCSPARLATHFDATAVLPDDVLRNPQAQTSSLLAGRKERIKDAGEIVFGDTDAAVAELDHDRWLQRLLVTRCRDRYLPFTFNCLLRVKNQIEKHLTKLI